MSCSRLPIQYAQHELIQWEGDCGLPYEAKLAPLGSFPSCQDAEPSFVSHRGFAPLFRSTSFPVCTVGEIPPPSPPYPQVSARCTRAHSVADVLQACVRLGFSPEDQDYITVRDKRQLNFCRYTTMPPPHVTVHLPGGIPLPGTGYRFGTISPAHPDATLVTADQLLPVCEHHFQ